MSEARPGPRAASNGHRRARVDSLVERVTPTVKRVAAAIPGSHPWLASLQRLQRQLPGQALTATGQLAMTLRDLTGRDVIDLER